MSATSHIGFGCLLDLELCAKPCMNRTLKSNVQQKHVRTSTHALTSDCCIGCPVHVELCPVRPLDQGVAQRFGARHQLHSAAVEQLHAARGHGGAQRAFQLGR